VHPATAGQRIVPDSDVDSLGAAGSVDIDPLALSVVDGIPVLDDGDAEPEGDVESLAEGDADDDALFDGLEECDLDGRGVVGPVLVLLALVAGSVVVSPAPGTAGGVVTPGVVPLSEGLGRWVEPAVSEAAGRLLSASFCWADSTGLMFMGVLVSPSLAVVPSVTMVPRTAARRAPAPAAMRLRREAVRARRRGPARTEPGPERVRRLLMTVAGPSP
jgi:hypothetical protein